MPYFALFYDGVDDFVARRAPLRAEHLAHAKQARDRGHLLLAGALAEPADGALLVFRADDRTVVEDFARGDPYVTSGLVARWHVRPWSQVIAFHPDDDGLIP